MIERCIVMFLETFKVLKYDSIQNIILCSRLLEEFNAIVWVKMIETYAKSEFQRAMLLD